MVMVLSMVIEIDWVLYLVEARYGDLWVSVYIRRLKSVEIDITESRDLAHFIG